MTTYLVIVGGVDDPRQTKVGQFERQVVEVDEQVTRLHVPVNDVCRVEVFEAAQQLRGRNTVCVSV